MNRPVNRPDGNNIIRRTLYIVPRGGGSITITIPSTYISKIYSATYNGVYIDANIIAQYLTSPIVNVLTANGITVTAGSSTNEIIISTGSWVPYDIPIYLISY